jgi:D-alanyl-D-alanine carboxypeptidase (penicillin-binding protein 5/6)
MKQFMTIFLSILFILGSLSCTSYASPLSPVITAPSAILMDADTGDILYQKNPHDLMYPASTTKIMTAILTLEHTNLNDNVTIDKDTSFTGGSRLYLAEDEVLTVEQLLYAMMVESANDAAVALAKHISGSVEDFSNLMNERAKQLGAKNTHFVNPNGLPDDNHITTAYDLAVISKYAMTLPKFQEIVQTPYYEISPTNKQSELRYLTNSNRFLWGTGSRRNQIYYKDKWVNIKYDIVDGIKTGYTVQAQQCLVTSAKKMGIGSLA